MQKRLKLFEKMFNMSSIVLYVYYNLYLTFQLNTLKKLPLDLLRSAEIDGFGIFILYKVKWRQNKCGMHATE